ncbi:MAG: uncharacterized protein QG652_1635 [Pseudomonadota bacterium]|nr:uncharacterized protein [Pseudomonadota bacterium]
MKKNYLILLLWLSAIQVTAWSQSALAAGAILHGQGLLWKIEKPGVTASYLYGTMHVSDERVTRLPPPVEQAFASADQFVMEMLPGSRALEIIARGSYFQDGRTLRSLMQAEDYLRLTRLMNNSLGLPENLYSNMRPWAVLLLVNMPVQDIASDKVLDVMLYRRARLRGIDLHGLETPQQQLAALETPTIEEQIWLLNKSVSRYSQMELNMKQMIDLYVQRNLAGLVSMQQQQMHSDSEIDDRFMHALLDERNRHMVLKLQDLLHQGDLFIAIGALHLPGENGVLHLLEQQGYIVTPVY